MLCGCASVARRVVADTTALMMGCVKDKDVLYRKVCGAIHVCIYMRACECVCVSVAIVYIRKWSYSHTAQKIKIFVFEEFDVRV